MILHTFFISKARLKLAQKNQVNAMQQHPEAELLLFHILHPPYHPKITGHILKISKRTIVSPFMKLYD